jgi:DNA-binding CsgD family transcriptional regulator
MTQFNQLSQREKDVAELLLQGKSNKQIATVLKISIRAVEYHLSNIYTKLDVASRTEAVLKLGDTLIRESTGSNLRETAVDGLGKIPDNGEVNISRRMPMKKLLLVIGGTLLITALIVTLALLISNTKKVEDGPTLLSNNSTQTNLTPPGSSASLQFEERILTDALGDAYPPFIDIISTRISQVEIGFLEIEFTVNGEIPLTPNPSYGNVAYKIWIDSNYDTKYPAHGGGNAEYVLNITYDINAYTWAGSIFDCALGASKAAYEVTIDGATAQAKLPLSLIGNPSSFRYSYESFTDMQGKDGDSNATMDQIMLYYNISVSQSEETLVLHNEPILTNTPTDSVRLSAYGVSFNVPGSWSNVPNAEVVSAGSNAWCKWPEHIKITLTAYPAQSEWKPVIYVYKTEQMPDWYPICPGAPLLRVRQQTLSHGERLLFGSKNAQPIFDSELIYAYNGKSPDGQYTIFAFFPVNFPLLAYSFQNLGLPLGGVPFNLENQDWGAYYQEVGRQLEAASDSDFTPNLVLLDAIAETITVTTP